MIKSVLNINGGVYKTSSVIHCELSYFQKITDWTEIAIYLKASMQSLSGTPISKKAWIASGESWWFKKYGIMSIRRHITRTDSFNQWKMIS